MTGAGVKFIRHDHLVWRFLHGIMAIFATKAVRASDPRGLSRAELAADVVDNGFGPSASVRGRDHVIELLVYSLLGVFGAVFGCLTVVALLIRPAIGPLAAGNAMAVGLALLSPLLGLGLTFTLRFARARHQFRGWEARGEPEHESPVNASLPGKVDLVVGIAMGAAFGLLIVVGMFAD